MRSTRSGVERVASPIEDHGSLAGRWATSTIGSLLQGTRRRLEAVGIPADDAAIEARTLLAHALDLSLAALYARLADPVPRAAHSRLEALVERRLRREPLAYILGRREFFGFELRVDSRVLIPRPETELVVEAGLRILASFRRGSPIMVDVGTGSGAIAIALARSLPAANVIAIDRMPDAIGLAQSNARAHGVADRVSFVLGDLLEPIRGPVDLILANLPYVPDHEIDALEPEVRDHEPRTALAGGPDGLALYRRLLDQVPARLRRPGALVVEIGVGQSDAARRLVHAAMREARIEIVDDYASIPRVLTAVLS